MSFVSCSTFRQILPGRHSLMWLHLDDLTGRGSWSYSLCLEKAKKNENHAQNPRTLERLR